ncbi:MAG TPA: hypothetical protein VEK57_00245 [Thermoanaerobaculia bacterium]|nr:hypothetical protein [Thermoanaerobaculia bacterium]
MIEQLRAQIRANYRPDFDFTIVDGVPFAVPSKPAAESRIALISTAGLHLDTQPPFDRTTPEGDPSYRRIHLDDDLTRLRPWWDTDHHQPASQDLNTAFPLSLLRDLCDLAPTHYTLSGSIPDPRPLLTQTAPALAQELRADAVDAALIAPS